MAEKEILNSGLLRNAGAQESEGAATRAFMSLFIFSEKGIPSADELICEVGEYYDADRAYIFGQDITRQFPVNTCEWCAEGVTPEIRLEARPVPFVPFRRGTYPVFIFS